MSKFQSKFAKQSVEMGEAFQLTGAHDRQEQIERTLERLKQERIKQAELECEQILDSARNEAHQVIELARQKAESIIQEGETQVEAVLKQGYTEGENAGFIKGHAAGLQQAEEETFQLLESAQLIMNSSYTAQEKILNEFKPQAIELIKHVTQKVLQRELNEPAEGSETLINIIDTAIENLHLSGQIKILVSVETLKTLTQYNEKTQEAVEKLSRYHLEADPLLDSHEIFVLSEEGNFVLSPEQQAQVLLKPIEKKLELPELNAEEINQTLENLPEHRQIEAKTDSHSKELEDKDDKPPSTGV